MDKRRSGAIINSIVASYVDSMYVNSNPELEELRSFAEANHVPVILKDAESFILMLLKLRNPSSILEIGTAVGYSAICFALGSDAHVTTIEADRNMYDAARSNISNFNCQDRIDIIYGDARETLSSFDEQRKYDMVFIDAAKSHYREFWDLIIPLCTDDAMIICDNVLMKGMTASDEFDTNRRYRTSIRKMREFLDYINNLEYADTSILPIGDGVSVSIIDRK
ncbi:MAG: O-methyltransferase [Clostridiales bacterium]|nr:O-methyltransferase [Clostridiales bacterium]MDD6540588.1 O-methyltransferase [Bacillota bacterium]MDD7016319.1 O-methyltransferase [Bacillota bacterium]